MLAEVLKFPAYKDRCLGRNDFQFRHELALVRFAPNADGLTEQCFSQRLAAESIRMPCNPSLATGFQSGNNGGTRDRHPKGIP